MQERQFQSVTARDAEHDHSSPPIEPHHFEDCVQLIFLNRFFTQIIQQPVKSYQTWLSHLLQPANA
jgi:hypothetical protein